MPFCLRPIKIRGLIPVPAEKLSGIPPDKLFRDPARRERQARIKAAFGSGILRFSHLSEKRLRLLLFQRLSIGHRFSVYHQRGGGRHAVRGNLCKIRHMTDNGFRPQLGRSGPPPPACCISHSRNQAPGRPRAIPLLAPVPRRLHRSRMHSCFGISLSFY
ncbi:hypothetical protein SAMN02910435_00557 [Ruminococcaceae bacterium D5]|nr:hypothetical protein SAMN02910435_00557 [Ruminococcaceae bacterium D5]